MLIDTRTQVLLRLAELRHMHDEAVAREATLTVRHLRKMITKTEGDLREMLERESVLASSTAPRRAADGPGTHGIRLD